MEEAINSINSEDQNEEQKDLERDAQEAGSIRYGNTSLIITPLSTGRFAIYSRDSSVLFKIVEGYELTPEFIRQSSIEANAKMHINRLAIEAAFYGEPDDRSLARDIRNSHKANRAPTKRGQRLSEAAEIDFGI